MSMKSMYELRDMLCDELDEIARKGELGAGDLDIVHKLASTIKNLDKIEAMEGGYSSRYPDDDMRNSYGRGCFLRETALCPRALQPRRRHRASARTARRYDARD